MKVHKNAKPFDLPLREDALVILQADHDHLRKLFAEFQRHLGRDDEDMAAKETIVREACDLLEIHTQLEEEIFYPALRKALREEQLMDQAQIEHDTAGELMDDLKKLSPDDEIFDAKFIVLSEIATLHMKKEEKEIFPLVRSAKLDMFALGRKILLRREVLVIGKRIGETLDEMNHNIQPVDEASAADAAGLLPDILVPPPGFR
ncbi:MAG: hemerythrin domain-containing protein [Alphaproteobacteria bacterium]|nr:hemerythrin domain-containing protein [Alphaproteobacteria bacterium]